MREKGFTRPLTVFISYALLTIIMTWPLAGLLGTHIPGSEGDAWVHQWTFRYVRDTLLNGGEIFYTDLMYHPDGVSLLYHNFAWLHIALWLPLQALVGEATAYTLIFLGGFAFTGLTTYLLARDVLHSDAAAYISGLIAAFWPYILSHHNHPNLIFIGFVPLVILYIKRVLETKQWRDVAILGVLIALMGITRWQMLVIGGFLIGLYLLWELGLLIRVHQSAPVRFLGQHVVQLGAAGLLALVLMLPLLSPLLLDRAQTESTDDLAAGEQRTGQTDLLAYLTPSRYHPLWGEAVFPLTSHYTVDRVFTPFIGFTTLVLAIYGIKKRWRSARFWLLAAVVYIILALGGYLQIYGLYSIPLPYLALEDTFIGAMVRRASRFNVILSIPVAILAGLGVMALRETLTQRSANLKAIAPRLVIPAVALLILFEYAVTYPTFELYTPPFYTQLAQDTDEYAILDLPMHRRSYDEQYMFYQFTHGKPLVGGHVSRPPSEAFSTINQVRFLKDFRLDREPIPEIKAVGAQLRPLAQRNVRYLILHKEFLNREQIQRWKEWLVIDPLYEDADLVAYHTDPMLGRDYTLIGEFLPEVGAVQALVTPTVTTQDGWLTADVVWGSATTVDDVSVVCLSLINNEGKAFETSCKEPEIPINKWQSGEIIRDRYRLHVNPYLAGGTYQLTAELRTYAAGLRIGERVTLSEIEVLAVERSFDRPQPMTSTELVWGDDLIDLVGYDLMKSETQLDLTLYWHAQQRPSDSYVVFVHLIDPATGQPVVQSDAAPRNWGYPTNWWEADEYIRDTVTLSLADLPSGRYELFVGMYQVNTPERLPVRQAGDLIENAAVKLTTVTTP